MTPLLTSQMLSLPLLALIVGAVAVAVGGCLYQSLSRRAHHNRMAKIRRLYGW